MGPFIAMPASYKYPPSSREHEKQQRPSVYTADEHVAQTCSSPPIFLTSFPIPALHFPITSLLHLLLCVLDSFLSFLCLPSLISPHLPSSLMIY